MSPSAAADGHPAGAAAGRKRPRRLTVADVIRAHAGEYIASRGGRLADAEEHVLRQLAACRTAALGGHTLRCEQCGRTEISYNSCRNRHCPQCGGPARARWLERVRGELLPVRHFQVVFTLPHELSRLALANRREVYGLLFRAAAETLLEVAADPRHLGARIGFLLVLHTWGQQLEHHPHVHAVVPGGGLSPDGERWIASADDFFLPVRVLSRVFRGKFLAGVKRLRERGELKLDGKLAPLTDDRAFAAWLTPLYEREWVVYCEPPPKNAGPDAVLKYLARHVAGTAISDRRLVSLDSGRVTFRWKNYRNGGRQSVMTLDAVEFLRRFGQHVLPKGLMRIRGYGLWSNARRQTDLPRCRELLAAAGITQPVVAPCVPAAEPPAESHRPTCRHCGSERLLRTGETPRPPLSRLREQPLWPPHPAVTAPRPRSDCAGDSS